MSEICIIKYKDHSYIIKKRDLESYEQFYHRAWLIVKEEPTTEKEYKKSILKSQKKINELYLGYVY